MYITVFIQLFQAPRLLLLDKNKTNDAFNGNFIIQELFP